MRNAPPRRHVLVVAPQCRSMEKLDRLEEAATDLYDMLADDDLGACRPGLPDDRPSLVTGHNLTSHEMQDWNPYHPESARPLADTAQDLVRALNYRVTVSTFGE